MDKDKASEEYRVWWNEEWRDIGKVFKNDPDAAIARAKELCREENRPEGGFKFRRGIRWAEMHVIGWHQQNERAKKYRRIVDKDVLEIMEAVVDAAGL